MVGGASRDQFFRIPHTKIRGFKISKKILFLQNLQITFDLHQIHFLGQKQCQLTMPLNISDLK
jgi:hypothetical protein